MICEVIIVSVSAVVMASTSGVMFLSFTLVSMVTMASVSRIIFMSFISVSVILLSVSPVFFFSHDKNKELTMDLTTPLVLVTHEVADDVHSDRPVI